VKIGIIGAGMIGGTLARRVGEARAGVEGHSFFFLLSPSGSTRSPAQVTPSAASLACDACRGAANRHAWMN
jgi:predicted dinucleotide-binding enzyme